MSKRFMVCLGRGDID